MNSVSDVWMLNSGFGLWAWTLITYGTLSLQANCLCLCQRMFVLLVVVTTHVVDFIGKTDGSNKFKIGNLRSLVRWRIAQSKNFVVQSLHKILIFFYSSHDWSHSPELSHEQFVSPIFFRKEAWSIGELLVVRCSWTSDLVLIRESSHQLLRWCLGSIVCVVSLAGVWMKADRRQGFEIPFEMEWGLRGAT